MVTASTRASSSVTVRSRAVSASAARWRAGSSDSGSAPPTAATGLIAAAAPPSCTHSPPAPRLPSRPAPRAKRSCASGVAPGRRIRPARPSPNRSLPRSRSTRNTRSAGPIATQLRTPVHSWRSPSRSVTASTTSPSPSSSAPPASSRPTLRSGSGRNPPTWSDTSALRGSATCSNRGCSSIGGS